MAKRDLSRRPLKKKVRTSSFKASRPSTEIAQKLPNDYVDVLQQIESILLDRYREDTEMDDRAASAGIRATLADAEPVDALLFDLVQDLVTVRDFGTEINDEVWRDALGVIDDSIHRHSRLQPGETSYLEYASRFAR